MKAKSKTKKLSDFGFIIIGLGLLATISILGYQLYHWKKNGEWLPLPFYKALQSLGVSFDGLLDIQWQGAQKLLFWILEQPLAGVIGVTSLVVGWLMTMRD
jgi:hypothetical protein